MERFRIAKYGIMQVTAIVYGVGASGAVVKFNKVYAEQGCKMSDGYYRALFYREHGIDLFVLVMIWTVLVSYLSSPLSKWDFKNAGLATSGKALAIFLALLGTVIALGGIIQPRLPGLP